VPSELTVTDTGVKGCWETECVGSAPVKTAIVQVLKNLPKSYPNSWIYFLITELYCTLIIDIYTSITAGELKHFILFFYE
jgi:hypothetical protein